MNFKNLASINWYKNYSNWLPFVQWLGWIIVVYVAAKIFWIWVLYFTAPSEPQPFQVNARPVAGNSQTVDINDVLKRDLFGSIVEAPQEEVVVEENVAPTRLNLKLRGIYAAQTKSKANAIIEDNRGKQAVYFIDDKLNVSGRVYLRQVFFDKVILETNGKREQLSLEKPELAITTSTKTNQIRTSSKKGKGEKRVDDKRSNTRLSQKLNSYRDKLLSDPKSVADVITGSPHMVDGELRGFKIRPGRDRRLFQELGLRNNDVVTAINGVTLDNMQDAMTLMSEAQSLQEVSVDIQRGNEQLSLLLNLSDKQGR
ncbi:type II secretion system protein GspC [Aliikangiella marina]|uniref:Type II secretion system protein GspC n=1 Tax=Aliikangiella marina TaxID=1712262 RepID=A0A545T9N6_9GAMM|nr:type II secretion system protein GspC [Aliikangiella marina]TQV73919.1 type II secretion system protein GspC [Aliikangiella marina]